MGEKLSITIFMLSKVVCVGKREVGPRAREEERCLCLKTLVLPSMQTLQVHTTITSLLEGSMFLGLDVSLGLSLGE